ncbi:MAG TPA: hypothetical protein PKH24_18530 [Sedimentisphaerales bacterium]|jgi:hypothetical protein|nr:hypothetical protein [Sedimentisphaerales bacterium]HNU31247.1 hypothetical protein [Sedimentisphaerales bacterium]
MSDQLPIAMGGSHRRGIAAALLLFDRMLCEVEEYAYGREVRSVLYVEHNTLSESQRTRLLAEISRIRRVLQELKDGLGLEAETEDVGRKIWGECSTFWEILVETKSRFLRRYGQPPDDLAKYLDPRIDALIGHLRNLTEPPCTNTTEAHPESHDP